MPHGADRQWYVARTSMIDVLTGHVPGVAPARRRVEHAFHPWRSV